MAAYLTTWTKVLVQYCAVAYAALAFIAEAAWASFHAYSLLVSLLSQLHERGAQSSIAAVHQVLGYRSALHTSLSVLSKRWHNPTGANSSLSYDARSL